MVEITTEEQNKVERIKRAEDNLRYFWDHTKCTNIQIIWVSEEEKKKKECEKLFAEFLLKDQVLNVWGFPCILLVASPLLLIILYLCV